MASPVQAGTLGARGAATSLESSQGPLALGVALVASSLPPPRVRGHVILWSQEAQLQVMCRTYDLPQVTQERAGGWDSPLQRTTGPPISAWAGGQQLQETLTLMLNMWPYHDVVPEQTAIRALGRKAPGLQRPPSFRVIGRTPYRGRDWVLGALTIVDQLYVRGKPARSLITLGVYELVDPKIEITKPKVSAASRSKAHWYTWRKSDTLRLVAQTQLGDADSGDKIRAANPKIKQWSTIAAGTRIRIPAVS